MLTTFFNKFRTEVVHYIESIIGTFTSTVAKLEAAAAAAKVKEAEEHGVTALIATQNEVMAKAEAQRANDIAIKIKSLIS